ncbi:hypothetical protein D8B26_007772 [Coccidioides posadasii str. Silveira]|uniref:Uncharacterized protein n=1 Tax=Coccidioides posadasii (strain RMSCC 757 / Silveira) TaxID=443226 RepID=E9D2Z7_COCPS|nr:conserved hypothetical protein [Coccidioides posadasii str. Silveira]QVM13156.1 hypothetical protein D8B26_007772 [Coccidioides posadasii str. Silveira]
MIRGRDVLPPPTIARTGQQKPALPQRPKPPAPPTPSSAPPPPLPSRKIAHHSNAPPTLPPRKSSDLRKSGDSCFSTSSVSTSRTATSRSRGSSPKNVLRAPAWGEATLPPLPPKKANGNRVAGDREPGGQHPDTVIASNGKHLSPNASCRGRVTLLAQLHETKTGKSQVGVHNVKAPPSYEYNRGDFSKDVPISAPKLPSRPKPSIPTTETPISVAKNQILHDPPSVPQRKIPPPPPPPATLKKIKESSLATLSKSNGVPPPIPQTSRRLESNQSPAPTPPPVPISSRPDLSKLQATKPRIAPAAPPPPTNTLQCLKCRDFSGPDTHATRFPRQSLPTQDLSWLAVQLTSPFPSATDKARVIFTWLHHNIEYDVVSFFNHSVKPSTPEQTLQTGLAVCEGYAGLFERLATHAGLEARTISGHGKGYGFEKLAPGSPLPPFTAGHAWNVVRIDDGKWKLIDCCWGAGCVDGHNRPYIKRFAPECFTMSNDDFGLRHYPSDKTQFYRDDGRPSISWEEYILTNGPKGVDESVTVFTNVAADHGIGDMTFQPLSKFISIRTPGPMHFEFALICEHWTLTKHSHKSAPYVFMIGIHGIDGRKDDFVPFEYIRGSGPGGGGDRWSLDIPDPTTLGAPGQTLTLFALTSYGDNQDGRGLTVREFLEMRGRKAMGWSGVAQWQLVA